jgi:hypothetical protein
MNSAMGIAVKTPVGPRAIGLASAHAKGNWHIQ